MPVSVSHLRENQGKPVFCVSVPAVMLAVIAARGSRARRGGAIERDGFHTLRLQLLNFVHCVSTRSSSTYQSLITLSRPLMCSEYHK